MFSVGYPNKWPREAWYLYSIAVYEYYAALALDLRILWEIDVILLNAVIDIDEAMNSSYYRLRNNKDTFQQNLLAQANQSLDLSTWSNPVRSSSSSSSCSDLDLCGEKIQCEGINWMLKNHNVLAPN